MSDDVTVLIAVDDEELNNELLRRVFHNRRDLHLDTVRSSEEALALVGTGKRVDLLLVDHSMPGISGVELLRQLRARGDQTPAVMVTAFPEAPEVIAAFNEGLARYIVAKPWRAADLTRTIDRALSRRKT